MQTYFQSPQPRPLSVCGFPRCRREFRIWSRIPRKHEQNWNLLHKIRVSTNPRKHEQDLKLLPSPSFCTFRRVDQILVAVCSSRVGFSARDLESFDELEDVCAL